ncbi:unnamed protein product [Nippostrongylus brasiliensis]|uniref:Histone-lysine N-methyltransferase SETMAR n=1 Tax=Nippostrongylus brasiliensis TaxID=27835 RepID=A0A158R3H6_NIPBR|nr:unnamed protein product [Nippostrongylus brasiliensis]
MLPGKRITVSQLSLLPLATPIYGPQMAPRWSYDENTAEKLSCSHSAVARGLRRAGYKNVKGGDVPHELTLDNKNRRIDCATELLTKRRTFAWLERLITGDESWVLYETPKVTRYWIPSSSDPPCRARAEAHQRKLLLCVWAEMVTTTTAAPVDEFDALEKHEVLIIGFVYLAVPFVLLCNYSLYFVVIFLFLFSFSFLKGSYIFNRLDHARKQRISCSTVDSVDVVPQCA